MRNLRAVVAFLVLPVAALAVPPLSRTTFAADDTTVAREHAQKGKAFMDLGKYTEAAAEYEAAYAVKPDPALLLNLAQAYRLAGNSDRALFFYRKYLQHVPRSPYRADIEEKIAALEKQPHAGSAPAPVGDMPAPQSSPLPPKTGDLPSTLPPPPPPPPPPFSAPDPGSAPHYPDPNQAGGRNALPPPAGGPGLATQVAPATPPNNHGQTLKLAGLVTGGVGVLSVVVGVVYGAQAKDAAQKIETAAANRDIFGPSLQADDTRGRSAQTKEVVFLVIGAAALATGGFLYYYGGHQQASEAGTVAILPAASATDVGAAVKVTF